MDTTTEIAHRPNGTPAALANVEYFSADQVALIKRQIAKGCTDDELKLFLYQCQRTGLDPFSRQIYAIRREEWDSVARAKVPKMTIQTGIDGLRMIADRTGRYAPGDEPKYARDEEGLKATAYVKKLVAGTWHVVPASAYYDEYAQIKQDGTPTKMWADKPRLMLAKCAEALALRKAFPAEMSGIYATEEMGRAGEAVEYTAPKDHAEQGPAAAGIAQEDDDGNAASRPTNGSASTAPKPGPNDPSAELSPMDVAKVRDALAKVVPGDGTNPDVSAARAAYVKWACGADVDGIAKLTKLQGSLVVEKARSGDAPPDWDSRGAS